MHARKPAVAAGLGSDLVKAGVVVACTVVTAVVCWLAPVPTPGGEAGVAMQLPDSVGPLIAFPEDITPAELYILPKDTTFARKTYGPPDSLPNDRILCSIILSGQEKRSIHRPERCLPAQGWRIDSSQTVNVPLASGHDLGATALLLERPVTTSDGRALTVRSYYLYWFVGKDVSTPSNTVRILLTNWDLLFHRVNQRWAYVIVSAYITKDWNPDGLGPEETLRVLKQFIHDSVPAYVKAEMPANATVSNP